MKFTFAAFTNLPPKVQQEWRSHFYSDDLPMEDESEPSKEEKSAEAEAEAVRKPFGWGASLGASIT